MTIRTVADRRRVLRDGLPLIDLRAPAEFALGAFPGAVNLPLLTDAERAAIGTRYKACGQQAAIALGEELVSGETRRARIDAWRVFIAAHPNALLYCWRGGLRSQIAQDWLRLAGIDVPRIEGGYKALRGECLNVVEEFCASPRLLVLAGRTGSGKTELLREFEATIDLERLVNHRGSAFGSTFTPQPTPIGFENVLAIEMLRKRACPRLLVEDESRTIGRLALPAALHSAMQAAPVVVLEASRDERAQRIYREYLDAPLTNGIDEATLHRRFIDSVDRIRRRLGGVRHAEVRDAIDAAFSADRIEPALHLTWIGLLLDWYYDPMYDHQLTAKRRRIVATGDRLTIRAFIRDALIAASADLDAAASHEALRLQP
jgi:tRNA 2-selenouridine synthase